MLVPARSGVALRALAPCASATIGAKAAASATLGCRAFSFLTAAGGSSASQPALGSTPFSLATPLRAKLRAKLSSPSTAIATSIPRCNFTTSPPTHTSETPNASAPASVGAATPNAPVTEGDLPPLDWNRFFQLRTIRRRYQLGFSVVGVVLGGSLGLGIVASGSADYVISMIPLDPLVSMGIVTVSCGGLGWLGGPALGTALFNVIHRGRLRDQMMKKEVEFFARIKTHRVDPSSSSAQNPVPDFYGERIQSVHGYRQWLRDQRAFNRKRRTFVS